MAYCRALVSLCVYLLVFVSLATAAGEFLRKRVEPCDQLYNALSRYCCSRINDYMHH